MLPGTAHICSEKSEYQNLTKPAIKYWGIIALPLACTEAELEFFHYTPLCASVVISLDACLAT